MREIAFAVDHIEEEIKNDKLFEAGLHDKKINFPTIETSEISELTESQKKAIDADRENFFKGK